MPWITLGQVLTIKCISYKHILFLHLVTLYKLILQLTQTKHYYQDSIININDASLYNLVYNLYIPYIFKHSHITIIQSSPIDINRSVVSLIIHSVLSICAVVILLLGQCCEIRMWLSCCHTIVHFEHVPAVITSQY